MIKANFLHDGRVLAALDALSSAIKAATGEAPKNMLLVAQVTGHRATAYHGCTCTGCALAMLTAAGEAFRPDAQATLASADDFAQRVH